ncbi:MULTISPECIES: DUF1641 domain-containing protein [Staphylococcus]|uniref:DUF1641 domain-containing protein n=1 Tax=Staphylococcus schleiferi TaxID=1295 RepID=A0ABX0FZW7_STASC|nr:MULTISPECIES: DUF1641 domain-containing protein [Staphylococcus]QGS46090.1 DUF1641 domain-containing protein [Mammaliicoccus fleurettii]EPD48037.1 hypothetical protein HMPREF1208_02078 [Staphylococcus sp. HGB0015]MBF1993526.1 DUF1641 domain-containing protein [Staphylococcus schleiferi]MBF2039100.1 DUF1641 domain-containing protein [Staphylococcus schleiferi]MBF2101076.1 DUF1641 domain-containing protein [Staphylococcus schleiferi]
MAERISKIKRIQKSEAEIKAERLTEVTDAIAENKDSILKAIELVRALDEAKILDAAKGAVKQRGVIAEKLTNELNKDQYSGVIHNMGQMVLMLGALDPEALRVLLNKVNKGLHVANQASPNARTSIAGFMRVLKDDEMNQSLTYFLNMLKGMSR